MGIGASLGKEAVLAVSGRAGWREERLFNRLQERLTQFLKEEYRLEEKNTR